MTAIFFSDVHLIDGNSVKTKLFLRFLQENASRFEKIYILGDLFDAWPGTNSFLVRSYRSVIQVLKRLVEEGHEIHYFEGNHDFCLGKFFSENLGIKVHTDFAIEEIGGKRVYIAHGDLGNPKEMSYRVFRYVLRRREFQILKSVVPQQWVHQISIRSSQISRDYQERLAKTSMNRRDSRIRGVFRRTAERLFLKGCDVVVLGHTHLPDDLSTIVSGRDCRYINVGDWVRHFTYLEFDGTQFYTKTHPIKNL
ncbi:MAG: UDP-2,3-diacylglucosamine diphosphatase [Deltaproteobacteria bacterium]|nr:UDP-2,3-diacylglucosamine diphosphatase [Deltaproteobacteria bacterium]